jgi:acetyl-CoA carboxylase biotin carboxyl carrier protein
MQWTERQILDTLRLIEESDYDEVRLETEGFKLHVRKSGAPARLTVGSASEAPPASVAPAPPEASTDRVSTARPAAAAAPSVVGDIPAGTLAIRAPMIGTFYRAPAPHLPPFVEVGANVNPDDPVCLIEVMKLFNTLKAGVTGRVVKIVAHNAAPVAKDEVLMLIETGTHTFPSGSSDET